MFESEAGEITFSRWNAEQFFKLPIEVLVAEFYACAGRPKFMMGSGRPKKFIEKAVRTACGHPAKQVAPDGGLWRLIAIHDAFLLPEPFVFDTFSFVKSNRVDNIEAMTVSFDALISKAG